MPARNAAPRRLRLAILCKSRIVERRILGTSILGYAVSGQDDRATMYAGVEMHDLVPSQLLRGTSGVSLETLCAKCKRKLDPGWINPEFRVSNRRRDITCTYDGYTL